STALAACAIGTLGAIFRRGPRRAFWAGFAILGWGYLALAFGPWFASSVRPHLLTTRLFDLLHARLHPGTDSVVMADYFAFSPIDVSQNPPALNTAAITANGQVLVTTNPRIQLWNANTGQAIEPTAEHFQAVGHALAFWLFALGGGFMARYFLLLNARDDRRSQQASTHPAARNGDPPCDSLGSPSPA
ncbi:MAG TPA: hypothetical protein VGZ22_08515, partial [Isosphaeraceae bacterium]|nr:hypothetical protein [Isosphaeraceae bacterium]